MISQRFHDLSSFDTKQDNQQLIYNLGSCLNTLYQLLLVSPLSNARLLKEILK